MPDRYLGQIISKYQVTRLLGSGAFSWVYEAIDQDLEIPVALKILRPEFSGQDVAEARFRREAATAARLRHRNIVTVRDVGQVDGTVFVAMDLHPLTLGRRLALAGRLPEAECIRIGTDVAAALSIAHAGGVIHRDIKPDNILLSTDGEAVVADFGLARALAGAASLSATNQVMGTPHYFSPEQARGQEIDGRSDLYALGITLYRAATGHLPFEGDDWYAVAKHHIETAPAPPRTFAPELSPEFEAVILRLLAKQPEQRYQSATQLLDALGALPGAPLRSVFTPHLGSHTVDAFPAVRGANGRTALVAAMLLLGAAMTWFTLRDRSASTALGGPTLGDSAPLAATPPADTGPIADSALGARIVSLADSTAARTTRSPARDSLRTAAPTRAPRATAARTARLEIVAADSARLYVDNRLVGTGRFSGDFPVGAKLAVRAVIANASTSCSTAVRDTVVTLKAGDRVGVSLPVRGCAVVSYDVTPRDARVTFTSLDGGPSVELRADSARALSLPEGRYEVRIQAPRCVMGTDTLQVAFRADGAPITRRFLLICS
ncbi:serine/threonine-protein kinase [Gemmatimonas groenlandica]|uniref:non-specific serine/threonine protein kinase n=1 Tax=Gemmatimonas groenlandica TaxID=2732249 RepID=A0A6M4IQ11_9BACT|nr:serine/threonine-protein kinase [Gemmatimonas groenlandica]QJR34952.1 serine/threonine protein kinase [Gemmatimonas groenlandica]